MSFFIAVYIFICLATGVAEAQDSNETYLLLFNGCPFTIWPAWLPNDGVPQLGSGGIELKKWEEHRLYPPQNWAGRVWARTGCQFDESGHGACETGDCNGQLACNVPGTPPATLAQFTPVRASSGLDFYDVSTVDGYNIPIKLYTGYRPECSSAGCRRPSSWLESACPPELAVYNGQGKVVACRSACLTFRNDYYCCTNAYNNPQMCTPNQYTSVFKELCPTAFSYPYDTVNTSFVCRTGGRFNVIFCPTGSLSLDHSILLPSQTSLEM